MQDVSMGVEGMFQRPRTLIFLQMHRDTNGNRILIQLCGAYTISCQEEGTICKKNCDKKVYRDTLYRGQGSI